MRVQVHLTENSVGLAEQVAKTYSLVNVTYPSIRVYDYGTLVADVDPARLDVLKTDPNVLDVKTETLSEVF